MIRAGIIGGAGYTAGELLRILLHHPDVEVMWVNSSSHAHQPIEEVHQGLIGDTHGLRFTEEPQLEKIDVLFFCTPHGETKRWMAEHEAELASDLKIVDLSADYRIEDGTHDFVYGLPELNRKRIVRGARHVANPGCFATAIQLALLPLAKAGMLGKDIHITGIPGSTGAGAKASPTTHYSWRNDNVSVYKPFTHQHLAEIKQTLKTLQPEFQGEINFIPLRGCFSRGILATIYLDCDKDVEEIKKLYEDYYDDHNFTFVTGKTPDLKDVVNTNKCILNLQRIGDKLLITSVIDNLLKGASGTAVHNMNLLFGLHERTGLDLKASAF